jgi:hypothetical protein
MRTALLAAVLVLAMSGVSRAQQEPRDDRQGRAEATSQDAARTTPRPHIRVLRNPYDLASFYRSGGSAPGGWAGLASDPAYGIARFYRSGEAPSGYGWSAFWTNGYQAERPVPFLAYRRTIGENGDLFLAVPFLAPVGPLSGAFFGY